MVEYLTSIINIISLNLMKKLLSFGLVLLAPFALAATAIFIPASTAAASTPSVTFTANPTSVVQGSASTLTWAINSGGDPNLFCSAQGTNVGPKSDGFPWIATLNGSGPTASGSFATGGLYKTGNTYTYSINCYDTVGGPILASASVSVTVVPPAVTYPSMTLTVSPNPIDPGMSSTLSWTVNNGGDSNATCFLNGDMDGSGTIVNTPIPATNGSQLVGPFKNTDGGGHYAISCTNSYATQYAFATLTINPPQATPPIVTITSAPASVYSGSFPMLSYTVDWGNYPADCLAINDNTGSVIADVPTSTGGVGSIQTAPMLPITTATTYTIKCTSAGGTGSSAPVTVAINTPVQNPNSSLSINLVATPTSVSSGGASEISWTVSGGDSGLQCTIIDDANGASQVIYSTQINTGPLTATTGFTLNCTDGANTNSATVTVNVSAPTSPVIQTPTPTATTTIPASPSTIYTTPTVHLTATPTSVSYGMGSTLTWAVSNGGDPSTSCNGTGGWNGSLSATGASWSTGALTTTTTYTLTCTNTAGQNSANVTVTVAPQTIQSNVITATPQSSTYALPTATIHATPLSVMAGQSSTLTWTVNTGGDSGTTCTLSDSNNNSAQVSAGTSQSTTGPLSTTTTYTFDCTNSAGQGYPVSATVVVVGTAAAATPVITPTTSATASGTSTSTATSSSCLNFTENFGRGSLDASTNGDVTLLQNFLASEGYFTQASTGYYGSITQAAVSAFQIKNGIKPVSGYVGPLTRAAIKGETCGG